MNKTECRVSQGFGQNVTSYYPLKGHPAIDNSCGYGTPIHSYWDKEYVYKVLSKENPANDGSGFTGVFTIVEQDGEIFEFLYGHCNPSVTVGQILTKGDVLGTEANNGDVFSSGVKITLEMQKAGDTRGSHRHDQKRILRKDTFIQPNTQYITGMDGKAFFYNGGYYAIPLYDNGYNGCVDWTNAPTLTRRQVLFKQMMLAVEEYQVECGLITKRESNYKNIPIGPRTLLQISKDRK